MKKIYAAFLILSLVILNSLTSRAAQWQAPTLETRTVNGSIIPFQNNMPLPDFARQERGYIELAGTWKKERQVMNEDLTLQQRTPDAIAALEKEGNGRHLPDYNDTAWENKVIPGVENPSPDRYEGGVWYRRSFTVEQDMQGKYLKLVFLAANYFTDVWLNGHWVGCHEGGYTPFFFNINPYIMYGQKNVLAVRVDNIAWVPSGNRDQKNLTVPCFIGDWWNYGGIKRDVYIEACPEVNIVRGDIKTKLTGPKKAQITAQVVLDNRSAAEQIVKAEVFIVRAELTDKNILAENAREIADLNAPLKTQGENSLSVTLPANGTAAVTFSLEAADPFLWSPAEPNLYVMEVKLYDVDTKQLLDKYYTQFGIREFTIDKAKAALLLNGQPLKLRGLARHEVYPGSGEVPGNKSVPQIIYNDFQLIKEANCNFIRTAHYPNHPFTQILADRMGFVIWEEIPVYWFGGPEFDVQRKERGIARQMWQEMIYQDYNRASVAIWSTCNECSWQTERALFIRDLRDLAYQIDGTRFVAQSASGSDDKDPSQVEADLLGYTMYYGVFYGGDYYQDTLAALDTMHKTYKDKPIIATEFGIWAPYKEDSQQLKQVQLFKDTMKAFNENPAVAGTVWWTAFDWHTMINDPGTMGIMTMDRKLYKKIFSTLQREYGQTKGAIQVLEPKEGTKVSGRTVVKASFAVGKEWPVKELVIDNERKVKLRSLSNSYYGCTLDTKKLSEGTHSLVFKARDSKGVSVSEAVTVSVDNVDEPPQVSVSPKDGAFVMNTILLKVLTEDDRSIASVKYAIDDAAFADMDSQGNGAYQAQWDVSKLVDGSVHTIDYQVEDTGKNVVTKQTKVTIDNTPGIYAELPYDTDWISSVHNRADGTGWDFPAEELPDSNADFIFMGREKIKYKFGSKKDGDNNTVECTGQTIPLPNGRYDKVQILASMHNGSGKSDFIFKYTDGTSETRQLAYSDWWGGKAVFDDEPVIVTGSHNEKAGTRLPGVGIFSQTVNVDPTRILYKVTLPNEPRLHIFAVSLEGEKVSFGVPEINFLSPAENAVCGGQEKISCEIKGESIVKAEYSLDNKTWVPLSGVNNGIYQAVLDTSLVSPGTFTLYARALDKFNQIGQKGITIYVFNKVSIIAPLAGSPVYKNCRIEVVPRAHSAVEKILAKIDKGKELALTRDEQGYYTLDWPVPDNYKPGSEHTITVTEVEKNGPQGTVSSAVTGAQPVKGHTINVDKNIKDWIGQAPAENTWTVSEGEFIWEDAKNDDTGPGQYKYPTNKAFIKSSDLREFRVTFDDKNLYLLITCSRPGDWWAPMRLVGIDTNGVEGGLETKGMTTLPGYGEINVSPSLACEYAIGISGSYKGFVWDASGKVIAKKMGKNDDTPGFQIDDFNWNNVEVAVPWTLLGGKPSGKTWRFIVAVGQQDNDHFREVNEVGSEWHGGGGEGSEGDTGPDPDIYDLASPSLEIQQKELGSYKATGSGSTAADYATIERSFLPVTFK